MNIPLSSEPPERSTSKKIGNLKPAHKGYVYQDLITAYVLAECLVHRYDAVTVDRKVVEGDRIDDLEIIYLGRRIRRQIKLSTDATRRLQVGDFTQERSSLRFDCLVQSYIQAADNAADEYRLSATWLVPDDANLLSVLEVVNVASTVSDFPSRCFRLKVDSIWPADGQPIWACLQSCNLTREQFIEFSARFVIELELPQASLSLFDPGPLEQALIKTLVDRIGIGRYPNEGRQPADAAARLLAIAAWARTEEATLTPSDIEYKIELQTNYGRVPQTFPIEQSTFQDRQALRPLLKGSIQSGKHIILTGPPGAGKSYELTTLADELKAEGALVAKHYCYIEPGDEQVERRVTSDVLFGNLIAELVDEEPTLCNASVPKYSAGLRELEGVLEKASTLDRSIVVIVDGIDHIARVLHQASSVTQAEADIVDQLCTLKLPPGTCLIIGSQPGVHLDPLRETFGDQFVEHEVPRWSDSETTALAHSLGASEAATRAGEAEPASILALIAEKSEGNPLYATYLSRELISNISSGDVTDVNEWLNTLPVIGGDIAKYYSHLYESASEAAQAIADILGVIDFGVSEQDLLEMLDDPLKDWLSRALTYLTPIISQVSGQGGIRIYHESFRRFMSAEMERQGRSIASALKPVIIWLCEKGFFKDARSYRFLMPAFRRAGRTDDAIELVDTAFVSNSIAYGHPREAIERNLALAIDMVAASMRWSDLVRCIELNRSAYTCFEGRLDDPISYWESFLALFGPQAVVEHLLFDGYPTQRPDVGLVLCSLIDDAGVTPPWRKYYEAPSYSSDDDTSYPHMASELSWQERVALARLHAHIRLDGFDSVSDKILKYLTDDCHDTFRVEFIRALSCRIVQSAGQDAINKIIEQCDATPNVQWPARSQVISVLKLGLADFLTQQGDIGSATLMAAGCVVDAPSPDMAVALVCNGASIQEAAAHALPLSSLNLGLGEHYIDEAMVKDIRLWISSSRLYAFTAPEQLDGELSRLDGEGWYRCWLRFNLALAKYEASKRKEDDVADIRNAFKKLSSDVRPFSGTPRACDLYQLRGLILESLAWGFSLLSTCDEWSEALRIINKVHNETSTSLQRSPSGPIEVEGLLKLLLLHVERSDAAHIIRSFVETLVAERESTGTYYEYHAEHNMLLARMYKSTEDPLKAQVIWRKVAIYLAGYGFRKDITIYELLDSARALMEASRDAALDALAKVQPLTDVVLRHTDGKETRQAPNCWFYNLLKCDSLAGLELLSRTLCVRDATLGWPISTAIGAVIKATADTANPELLTHLYSVLPFEVDHESESKRLADERLAVIERLLNCDLAQGVEAFNRLVAQVGGDGRSYKEGAVRQLREFAKKHTFTLPELPEGVDQHDETTMSGRTPASRSSRDDAANNGDIGLSNCFAGMSMSDILVGIRCAGDSLLLSGQQRDKFVNALGYRLLNLVQNDREDDAIRVIRYYSRISGAQYRNIHPLAEVAEGLERHGYNRAAAVAYALAYVRTRGEGGWLMMGGMKHVSILIRGIQLERHAALESVAVEIAYMLRDLSYHAGLSRHIIECAAAWGEPHVAVDCWQSAYDVIQHRLPTDTGSVGWFERLQPDESQRWSINEGIIAILLGCTHHPILNRKIAALAGVCKAIVSCPDVLARPLRIYLSRDATVSSTLLVLFALVLFEKSPYSISKAMVEVLNGYAISELWGLSILARKLLDRAGMPLPKAPQQMRLEDRNLSRQRVDAILTVDCGGRVERLEGMWPDIPHLLASRFDDIYRSSAMHDERCKASFRLSYGNDGKVRPSTPLLHWHQELFEVALQEVLSGINSHLWATGTWFAGVEDNLLKIVMPNIVAHLGINASRVVRPSYSKPHTLTQGLKDVAVLDQDPLYNNWRRIAYYECQWVREDSSRYGPPTLTATIYAGAVAVPLGDSPPDDASPFREADIMDWWTIRRSQRPLLGPLTGCGWVADWLGNHHVLIPPAEIAVLVNVVPPKYGDPIAWKDEGGQPIVVFRTWRMRDPEQYDGEPLEFEGADLLMCPDIYEKLEALIGVRIQELSVKNTQPLSQ